MTWRQEDGGGQPGEGPAHKGRSSSARSFLGLRVCLDLLGAGLASPLLNSTQRAPHNSVFWGLSHLWGFSQ